MWPGAPEELGAVLRAYNVPDDEINKMTHENAMRWYSFDPFSHIPRSRPPSVRCAKPPRATTSRSGRCPSTSTVGASFADFAASAKELTGDKD